MARRAGNDGAAVRSVRHALWVGALLAVAGGAFASQDGGKARDQPPAPVGATGPVGATAPVPAPAPAPAPAAAASLPLPSATNVIARNAEARGGLPAWHALESLSELGHLEKNPLGVAPPKGAHAHRREAQSPNTPQVSYRMYLARPHKLHLEVQVDALTAIQMFDGESGCTITPSAQGPVVRDWGPAEVEAAAGQQDLDGPLIDAVLKGTKVKVEAIEPVQGRDNYRLALTLKSGLVRHLWVDAETYLDTKIDGTRIIGDHPWPTETYFSGYKRVGAVLIPHVLETTIADVHSAERIVIDRIVVNQKYEDSFFTPPVRSPSP